MRAAHLTAARAADLDTKRGRFLYRIFETIPGVLAWGTLAFAFLASWLAPTLAAFFIISFVLYWLLRVLYFALHLRAGYKKTRQHEKRDWLLEVKQLRGWERVYHLIVIPTYREPLEVLQQTFLGLKDSDYPKEKMIVVLAIEERAKEEGKENARLVKQEFEKDFFRFLVTVHPADLAGEIAGKGSNETWAVKRVKEQIIDPLHIPYEDIIVSSLDADTVVMPRYFSCLTYHYLTSPNPLLHSYQPVPLFINNIWSSSVLSRLFAFSTTFWFLMNQERPEKLSTFSSHSMPFKALFEV